MRYLILLLSLVSIIKLTTASILIQKRWAFLNITVVSKSDSSLVKSTLLTDSALYGTNSPSTVITGKVVPIRALSNPTNFFADSSSDAPLFNSSASNSSIEGPYGCSKYLNTNLPDDYIALVSRGECTFEKKIQMAVESGASAIIIYNNDQDIFTMLVRNNSIPNVLVVSSVGYLLLNYMHDYEVYATLKPGPIEVIEGPSLPSKISVYFVSIAFVIVLVVTTIWLSVYYVQRYRYYNAKKRLDSRLKKATQKALTKIPVRKLKVDDREVNETCAICLENYAVNDSIRELPCGHYFHQKDVDLWLVEHRTCPMCKINILQACGIEINRSRNFLSQYMSFMRGGNRHHTTAATNPPEMRYYASGLSAQQQQSQSHQQPQQSRVVASYSIDPLNGSSGSEDYPFENSSQVVIASWTAPTTKPSAPRKTSTRDAPRIQTISENAQPSSLGSLTSKLLASKSSMNNSNNRTVANDTNSNVTKTNAIANETTASESESNQATAFVVRQPLNNKSSENKVFQSENEKIESEVPL